VSRKEVNRGYNGKVDGKAEAKAVEDGVRKRMMKRKGEKRRRRSLSKMERQEVERLLPCEPR
jgi:hypothetical protein